jgi:hypothetical protein
MDLAESSWLWFHVSRTGRFVRFVTHVTSTLLHRRLWRMNAKSMCNRFSSVSCSNSFESAQLSTTRSNVASLVGQFPAYRHIEILRDHIKQRKKSFFKTVLFVFPDVLWEIRFCTITIRLYQVIAALLIQPHPFDVRTSCRNCERMCICTSSLTTCANTWRHWGSPIADSSVHFLHRWRK